MNKSVSDEPVIKALKCLAYHKECVYNDSCEYYMDNGNICDNISLAKDILNIYDAQQAEIEKLTRVAEETYKSAIIALNVVKDEVSCSNTRKFNVITLCGSTKFKDAYIKAAKELSLAGNVVITLGLFGHSGDEEAFVSDNNKMLYEAQLQKIDMADELFVLNVGGYIGESTKKEIAYAVSKNKKVTYLEPVTSDN